MRKQEVVRAKTMAKLDAICDASLDRLLAEIHRLPVMNLAITAGIMLDKRKDLEQLASAQSVTVRETVTVNGLGRDAALAFIQNQNKGLNLDRAGDDSQLRPSLTISRTVTGPATELAAT